MPKASSRPSLPATSLDFALPPSGASSSALTLDDPTFLLQRFRRPSLQKAGYLADSRLHSPLASSFTPHYRRRSLTTFTEESESDRELMVTDSPCSSENNTPSLRLPDSTDEDRITKPTPLKLPLTPPRRRSSVYVDLQGGVPLSVRRLSFPPKQPRIINLLAESRPEECEVKSEAAFQRLITSCSELPRTPRPSIDKGRYPEEAGGDDFQREETPSDEEEEEENKVASPAFNNSSAGTQLITAKSSTPTGSTTGSVSGDDLMCASESSSGFGTPYMDVDMPSSPCVSSIMSTPINQWRYTPPPTTSAVRSNKRKFDDRFDPYLSSSKRRAVSPSMAYLRDSHPSLGSPISRVGISRIPISIHVNGTQSNMTSATSSPTMSGPFATFPRTAGMTASPILRPTIILASPILRPMHRSGKRDIEDEREIEGTGKAVGGITLC